MTTLAYLSATSKHKSCPTHCCPKHGCKYSYQDCPVATGKITPMYPRNNGCEICEEDHMQYETMINIKTARVMDVPTILEAIREVAGAEYDTTTHDVRIVFDVGPDGSANDLWDLRDVVSELETRLSGYLDESNLPRPKQVT